MIKIKKNYQICRVCIGKGTIPNPNLINANMFYRGNNGEVAPQIICQNCNGIGWTEGEIDDNRQK